MDRNNGFRLNFTTDEREMLRQLAEAQGVTSADVLRLFIRREHAATVDVRAVLRALPTPELLDRAAEYMKPAPTPRARKKPATTKGRR